MKITFSDKLILSKYLESEPKQFGTLHERMKYLIAIMNKVGVDSVGNDLWQAVYDLETEVKYIDPPSPPFGRRHHSI